MFLKIILLPENPLFLKAWFSNLQIENRKCISADVGKNLLLNLRLENL